ncbi:MAG: hypothetical protein KKI09_12135 [Spirochaetes bacterium]|nr:hypothetical protein [Spirochaetota bacterium]
MSLPVCVFVVFFGFFIFIADKSVNNYKSNINVFSGL